MQSEFISGVKDVAFVLYYVFIRGKDKRSEGDLLRPSIIGAIPIRSSPNTLAY